MGNDYLMGTKCSGGGKKVLKLLRGGGCTTFEGSKCH